MSSDILKQPLEAVIGQTPADREGRTPPTGSDTESDCSLSFDDDTSPQLQVEQRRGQPLALNISLSQDWQLDRPLASCLGYLLSEERFADVSFVFPEDDKSACLPAHKTILAARSPYMEAIFFGPVASKNAEVEVANYSYEAFYDFVKFLYTDQIQLTEDNASEVLRISHEYRVPKLTARCATYLSEHLTADNVLHVFKTADLLGLKDLQLLSTLFIDKEATAVLQTADFVELSLQEVSRILRRDTLQTPEITVYLAAVEWAKAECTRQGLQPTGANKRRVLCGSFNSIRMTQVTATEFADVVVKDELLTQKEMFDLLLYFSATEKSQIDLFPNTNKRMFPQRVLFCQKYDEEATPMKPLDEDFTLTASTPGVLMGVILTKVVSDQAGTLDLFEGSITIINDGDDPVYVPFEVSVQFHDDATEDVLLEKPILLHKDKEYKMIMSGLTGGTAANPEARSEAFFSTCLGKFPAMSFQKGPSTITLVQSGKRNSRSPLVGLLMVM